MIETTTSPLLRAGLWKKLWHIVLEVKKRGIGQLIEKPQVTHLTFLNSTLVNFDRSAKYNYFTT